MAEPKRGVDMFSLLMAVLFGAVAASGLIGYPWWMLSGDLKWIAAGLVAAIGMAMVLSSLPARRHAAGSAQSNASPTDSSSPWTP